MQKNDCDTSAETWRDVAMKAAEGSDFTLTDSLPLTVDVDDAADLAANGVTDPNVRLGRNGDAYVLDRKTDIPTVGEAIDLLVEARECFDNPTDVDFDLFISPVSDDLARPFGIRISPPERAEIPPEVRCLFLDEIGYGRPKNYPESGLNAPDRIDYHFE